MRVISLTESDSRAAAVFAHTFINPLAVDSPSLYTVFLSLHWINTTFRFASRLAFSSSPLLSSFLSLALWTFILVRAYHWAHYIFHWFEFNGCQTLALCVRRMPPAMCSKILPSLFRSFICILRAKLHSSHLSLLPTIQ